MAQAHTWTIVLEFVEGGELLRQMQAMGAYSERQARCLALASVVWLTGGGYSGTGGMLV